MAQKQREQQLEGIPLGFGLTEDQAKAIVARGQEAVVFALPHLAAMTGGATAAEDDLPATPSGMKAT